MNTEPRFTTVEQLVPFLMSLRSAQVATMVAVTEVRMNKTGNPFYGLVRKVQKIKLEINNSYENKVNDARDFEEKATDFEVAPLQWGNHASAAVIENKGALYLQSIVLERDPAPIYIDASGMLVNFADIKPFLPPKRPNARQDLEQDVQVLTWKMTSIFDLWMGDKHIYKASGVVGPRTF
jgi:hypothetical protein